MPRPVTSEAELGELAARWGPDTPENAALISRIWGHGAKEVAAANAFWETGRVPDLALIRPPVSVHVSCEDEPPGVAVLEEIPRGRWSTGRRLLMVRCREARALDWMLSLLPSDELCEVELDQQDLLPKLEKAAAVRHAEDRLYYTVDKESFKPAEGSNIRPLNGGDEETVRRFSESEASDGGLARFYLALQLSGHPYECAAALDAGEISSFCCVGMKTEKTWSMKWICTRAGQRSQGEGRRAASAATMRLLETGRVPVYSLRERNAASRRLCESLGYRLVSVMTSVHLTKHDR